MKNLQERKHHGRPGFPFAVYRGNLPEYIVSYPLHWHEEMELIYVVSGCGNITVQAEHFTVRTGDIVVIPPQRVHSIEQLADRPMEYFNILFRLSLLDSEQVAPVHQCSLYHLPYQNSRNEAITGPVLSLIENRKQTDPAYPLLIRANLSQILYQLLRQMPGDSEPDNRGRLNYDRLKVVLEYLREHYSRPISVAEAAAMCGFSASHFMKLFRELTGLSFAQYVKQLRLEAAARLLRENKKRIGEIAEETGFHNLSYFTRAFEAKYHMTPGVYRSER